MRLPAGAHRAGVGAGSSTRLRREQRASLARIPRCETVPGTRRPGRRAARMARRAKAKYPRCPLFIVGRDWPASLRSTATARCQPASCHAPQCRDECARAGAALFALSFPCCSDASGVGCSLGGNERAERLRILICFALVTGAAGWRDVLLLEASTAVGQRHDVIHGRVLRPQPLPTIPAARAKRLAESLEVSRRHGCGRGR